MMEQLAQLFLPIETGGSDKFLVGIAHLFRTHRENPNDPTILPTIAQSNQATGWVHSDQNYFPLESLKSVTDV